MKRCSAFDLLTRILNGKCLYILWTIVNPWTSTITEGATRYIHLCVIDNPFSFSLKYFRPLIFAWMNFMHSSQTFLLPFLGDSFQSGVLENILLHTAPQRIIMKRICNIRLIKNGTKNYYSIQARKASYP